MKTKTQYLAIAYALFLSLFVSANVKAQFSQLQMLFTNNSTAYNSNNIWITIARGQNPALDVSAANVPDVTYGGTPVTWHTYTNILSPSVTQTGSIFADPILLSTIQQSGGLTWISNAASAAVYISYGAPIPVSQYSISGISPSATTDASYNIPYQNFELTYYGNGDNSGNGDLTAINFLTAPISLSNFTNSTATGPALETKGFNPGVTGATLLNQFKQISAAPNTPGSPILTSSSNPNVVTRVLGPTQFGAQQPQANDFGTYTNFNSYFGSLYSSNTTALYSNYSGYNTIPTPMSNSTYSNVNVTFVLPTHVTTNASGYGLSASGTISAVTTYFVNGVPQGTPTTNTFANVTFSVIPGTNSAYIAAAFTYYGDYSTASTNPGGGIIAMGGAGWTSFTNFVTAGGFVDGKGNPAASIVNAQIAGEISTGYDAGLPGSTNIINFNGTNVQIGTLPSADWWGLANPPLFSTIQTNPYYNQYANVIYQNSSNSVYGMTYGDRFTNPLASPHLDATTNIGSWLVGIADPVGVAVVPEPSYTWAILLFLTSVLALRSLKFRKKSEDQG